MTESPEFLFGYEIEDEYRTDASRIIGGIKQGFLKPYNRLKIRIPAPNVPKKGTRFSSEEIMTAAIDELRMRREAGLAPLIPMTSDYDRWFDERCREKDYSWSRFEDSAANRNLVRQWLFLRIDVDALLNPSHNTKLQDTPTVKKESSLTHTEKVIRAYKSKYYSERVIFEKFAKDRLNTYKKANKPRPTIAETIRAAKAECPDLEYVPDKRMRFIRITSTSEYGDGTT